MADPINGINTNGVDLERFKKLAPQEIIKQQSEGEEIPAEIVTWAKEVLSFAQIPDNVTYEQVGGDVGIEALNQLGIPSVEQVGNIGKEGVIPEEENPEIPEPPQETPDGNNTILDEPNEDEVPDEDVTLADSSITSDDEEIRRRKARKGIVEE